MKRVFKIVLSNWINVVGVFTIVLTYATIITWQDHTQYNLFQALLAAGIGVCLYGFIFWATFISQLIILDILFFGLSEGGIKIKLLIEWIIISAPFTYGIVKYNEWILAIGIVGFAVSQCIRAKRIMN